MGWSNQRLIAILADCCGQFRKGPERTDTTLGLPSGGRLGVTEIYDMPPAGAIPEECEVVDMHFVAVAVNKAKAENHRAELIELLDSYPEPKQLAGGPSYIHVGGVVGDQGLAFELFALGKVLGIWDVITPERLGFTGAEARDMAGMGWIHCTGYHRKAAAA